jgi:hypothetical protein
MKDGCQKRWVLGIIFTIFTDSQTENEKVPCSNRLQMKTSEQEVDKVEQKKKLIIQLKEV